MRTTRFFGIFGAFSAASAPGELLQYATELTGPGQFAASTGNSGAPAFSWAPDVASDERFTVALLGEAVWTQDAGNVASAATILAGYRSLGTQVLQTLDGRYSLAITDGREQRLVLAVDPMGVGRLAYAVCNGAVVYSTSAEAVARFPPVNARVRNQSLFDYLFHHFIPSPQTVFEGVHKLPPAMHLIVSRAGTRLERHWSPKFRIASASFEILKDELHEALRVAVSSSHPEEATGAFLSGGLDSSTVAGVLSQVQRGPAKTFSIGFGYPDYDELPYARIANARFGCAGHEYVIGGRDIAATFHKIAQAYDEPFGNSSALPAYHCALMARDAGVEHLLAGDGGDELFAGNTRYADQRVFDWYQHVPSPFRRGLLEPALRHWPQAKPWWLIRKARGYVEQAVTPLPARLENWNFILGLGPEVILHPEFLASVDPAAPFARMQEVWDSTPSDSTLQRMLYFDWHYTLADNDLRKVEVMSALAGVHVSYPMLHHGVVDLSTRIAPGLMMPGRKLRHFYKRAMAGFLPDEILRKKKHGFGLPFGLWLKESSELRDLIHGSLTDLRKRRIVRADFLDRLLHLHGHEDARYYGVFIWVLAMLEQWLQEHRISP